jgi:hypothetical protein
MLSAAAFAGSATAGVSALAHGRDGRGDRGHGQGDREHRGEALLRQTLAPSVPTDPALNGNNPGGVPWVLQRGEAKLRDDGTLEVEVRGLVIPVAPFTGTTGPVKTVSASLYCGASTTAQGTTPSAPISTTGDAFMEGTVNVPAKCLQPTVLVHPNPPAGATSTTYIAATGFGG